MFFSIHRYGMGFYPGTGDADETGKGKGRGYTLNAPIRYGTSRKDYQAAFRSALDKAADQIKPELVLLSAGFDAHARDPIGSLGLEVEDFVELTRQVLDVAKTHAGGRLGELPGGRLQSGCAGGVGAGASGGIAGGEILKGADHVRTLHGSRRTVMQLANQEAIRFNHEYIGTEHILLGLVEDGSGVAANALKNLDIDLRKIRLEVEKIVQSGPHRVTMGKLPQTPRAKKVIEYAIEEARTLDHNYVGTEHLLLGLLREGEGVASQVFLNLGLTLGAVRGEVLQLLGFPIVTEESCSGRELVRRCSGSGERREKTAGKIWSDLTANDVPLAALRERIRSLETQLGNIRVLFGAGAGAVASASLCGKGSRGGGVDPRRHRDGARRTYPLRCGGRRHRLSAGLYTSPRSGWRRDHRPPRRAGRCFDCGDWRNFKCVAAAEVIRRNEVCPELSHIRCSSSHRRRPPNRRRDAGRAGILSDGRNGPVFRPAG